jgi:hypothetical protein
MVTIVITISFTAVEAIGASLWVDPSRPPHQAHFIAIPFGIKVIIAIITTVDM